MSENSITKRSLTVNSMKKTVLTIIYFLTGLLFIIIHDNQLGMLDFITKALIIPLLMVYFVININPLSDRLNRSMFAGLFFSWAGDVILELSNNNPALFTPGLLCFLAAHVMYFTVFVTTKGKNSILTNRIGLLVPVIIYGITLVAYLYSDLGPMRLPVIVYAIVILTMLSGAINRKEKVNRRSYLLVLSGAILFVISDSVIAVSKFSYKFESSGIVIMSTYILAQYLIVSGYIIQYRDVKADQISL
jgi:uncharacterized membrane protein YhhN